MISRFHLACAFALLTGASIRADEFVWRDAGPGLATTCLTNAGPVIFNVVRVDRSRLGQDLFLTTTLGSNRVVGMQPLSNQLQALPKEMGTPVAAMNADFYMMSGAAKGDPRGLHILRGELVSVPTGPAAFWIDAGGKFHGEQVISRLTVSWPGGGTNFSGLNEHLATNSMVLFTPRMGRLFDYRPSTNRASTNRTTTVRTTNSIPRTNSFSGIPQGGFIRPPGGREWTLEPAGAGPWLPLQIGRTYHARTVTESDGFTNVPPNRMLMMLGSNLVTTLPRLTNGTPVTITVATEPDLSGVDTGIGTGPMLVRAGKRHETTARMSEQKHPRAAFGWNDGHLFFAVADGRQPGLSVGTRLEDMADFMIALGCEEVINMDGGVSTTLMLNGETINHPSEGARNARNSPPTPGRQREIANALVILRKEFPAEDAKD